MSLRLADLLAGLSRLADLGFGLDAGESLRSAALALALARQLELHDDEVRAALYTALLHHVGCTGYAHETAQAFGDELALNVAAGRSDAADPRDTFTTFLPTLVQGRAPLERIRMVLAALSPANRRFATAFTTASCEVGRLTARRLGLPEPTQQAIYHVYELWQGGGEPAGLAGDEIPVASRVARLTGIAVLFDTLGGPRLAAEVVGRRGGGMLDPGMAGLFVDRAEELLGALQDQDPRETVLAMEPAPVVRVPEPELVAVAEVFGDLADLKTPHTHGHAREVAALAREAGRRAGLDDAELTDLEVAALLHDIGRVAVSNRIWEKAGELTGPEWEQVRLHPYHSERVLAGSERLVGLAPVVGMHHERLDGSGYHRGARASQIPRPARILAAADTYHGMVQQDPLRPALRPEQAEEQLSEDARRGRLDADAVSAVLAAAGHDPAPVVSEPPAGLTDREVEVLGLVAAGCSNAEIGERLVISRRTAEHHVQNIYRKLGTSSRAAAALFAMEHGLLE